MVARKEGFVGLVGTVILFVYFLFSSIIRVFAVVILFTPLLGLFDTMSHLKLSKYNFYVSPLRVFDVGIDGRLQMLDATWNNTNIDIQELTVPGTTAIIALPIIVAIHLACGCFLLKPLQRHKGRLFLQSIFSLVCTPIFADWEEFQRCFPGTDILECWKKSWFVHRAFLVLTTIEHLVCLIPLAILKVAVDKRNNVLENSYFPPLQEEIHSTYVINCLLTSGVVIFLIAPFIQSFLAKTYFKSGHGWARILNAHLRVLDQQSNANT